jgi:hypothetical protein
MLLQAVESSTEQSMPFPILTALILVPLIGAFVTIFISNRHRHYLHRRRHLNQSRPRPQYLPRLNFGTSIALCSDVQT